jgi:hypothetical protein
VPAGKARGAIVEKGEKGRKAIGDYLYNLPNPANPANQCGSGLAREYVRPANIYGD